MYITEIFHTSFVKILLVTKLLYFYVVVGWLGSLQLKTKIGDTLHVSIVY